MHDMRRNAWLTLLILVLATVPTLATTPKLNIKTKHGNPQEERKKEQIEKLAAQYDLAKYTITRDIIIEQGAMNHSMPVLTLNLRFLENDDLALSAYVHEQGHWLLSQHRGELNSILNDLLTRFPGLEPRFPEGSGDVRDTYFHIVVCMLEWQAMEQLIGVDRARDVIEWKRGDHYKGIYRTILERRDAVEGIMKKYHIKF
jgi:hypothetical protein